DELTGLLQLIETHRNARRDVPFLAHDLDGYHRVKRWRRQIDPRIEGLATGAAGESDETETAGELREHLPGPDKPIAKPGVLIINVSKLESLSRETSDPVGKRSRAVRRKIDAHSTGHDGIEQITLTEGHFHRAQQLFLES